MLWQITSFISFLIFIWFLIQILRSSLFWLYLWQLKEYRFDRVRVHLSLKEGQSQLKSSLNPALFGIWRKPVFSLRLILTGFLLLIFQYQVFFLSLKIFSVIVKSWPIFLFPVFDLALVVVFYLIPFLMIVLNFVFGWLLFPFIWLIKFLAKKKISLFKPLVIGITGSFAKTSTKEILRQVLSVKYKVLATPLSVNTPLGVAKTILFKLKKQDKIFIVEMGAYKKGEIDQLTNIVKPKIGILTGVNPQHKQLFGSTQAIAETKYELIKSLPKNGLALFNLDNAITASLFTRKCRCSKKSYAMPTKKYQTNLLGDFQQLNIEAVMKIVEYLKVPYKKSLQKLIDLDTKNISLVLKIGLNNCQVLDDSRNTNPDGFIGALETLASFNNKKKVVVTAGIIELGNLGVKIHRRLGKKISQVADELLLTSPNFLKDFKLGAGKDFAKNIILADEKNKLKNKLKKLAGKKTIFLLEGKNWQAFKVLLKKKGKK